MIYTKFSSMQGFLKVKSKLSDTTRGSNYLVYKESDVAVTVTVSVYPRGSKSELY